MASIIGTSALCCVRVWCTKVERLAISKAMEGNTPPWLMMATFQPERNNRFVTWFTIAQVGGNNAEDLIVQWLRERVGMDVKERTE